MCHHKESTQHLGREGIARSEFSLQLGIVLPESQEGGAAGLETAARCP